jgi:hypothetical protein
MNDERALTTQTEDQLGDANSEASSRKSANDALEAAEKTKDPTVHKARQLDDARYAALECRAYSDEARALVRYVTNRVTAHELAAATRTNKRKKKQTALSSTIERLLADLLAAQGSGKANGYVYRPMRPESFSEGDVSYRVFKALADALVDLGLLERHKGFRSLQESFDRQKLPIIQKATRFRATQKLLSLCEQHGVRAADFHQHFLIPLPEHPLQLRAASKRSKYGDKIRGRRLPFKATALTDRLEKQLKELNEFLDGFELRGGVHRGYLRIFNNGDNRKFKWNMGGRLYSHTEENYQQMESADRLRMTINGDAVCEIDIRASYLTIFHALFEQQLDRTDDPYEVPGLGLKAREVVKMWVTASFGSNAPITRWPREVVKRYQEKTGKKLDKSYSASKVAEKVLERFPLLSQLSEDCGWGRLMFIESEAVVATMLELMGEQIPSLAVHDSIIVPHRWRQKAIKVLTKHYKAFSKATPVLTTKIPEGCQEDPWNF